MDDNIREILDCDGTTWDVRAQRLLLEWIFASELYGQLVRLAYRYTQDLHRAEDVVQVVLMRLFIENYCRSFKPPAERFHRWLRTCVINEARKPAYHSSGRKTLPLTIDVEEKNPDQNFDVKWLWTCSNELPPLLREAIQLRIIQGLSCTDAAKASAYQLCTQRAMATRTWRAIEILRECWNE
jgi:RNA polymerase sigma factor (sigma-70 family)